MAKRKRTPHIGGDAAEYVRRRMDKDPKLATGVRTEFDKLQLARHDRERRMSNKTEKLGGVFHIDEGSLKKGGVNEQFQISKRPPDPPPMRPAVPPPPSPGSSSPPEPNK